MKRDISGVDSSSNEDDSGSGSEESSSGSESEVELLSKPIFLKKKKLEVEENVVSEVLDEDNGKGKADDRILKNLSNIKDVEDQDLNEFDGVDDYDDNEEEEYNKWRIREYGRYQRDKQIAIELEVFKQEQMNRSNMTEDELIQQFEQRKSNHHIGPFQNDKLEEFQQKILQRDYSQKEIDHSRPTRFKQV